MKRTIHILSNSEKNSRDTEDLDVEYLTPEEAVGELVEIEWPGTMGKEVYVIEDVDLEQCETKLKNLSNGNIYLTSDNFLPPAYNHFSRPRIGKTFTVEWLEHLNGRNEWVQTTPEINRGKAETYFGFYEGHEKTRVVEKTYKYIPSGVLELDIRRSEDSYYYCWDKDIESIDKVYRQIDAPEDARVVGQIYVDKEGNLVWYNIDYEYRANNYTSPLMELKE